MIPSVNAENLRAIPVGETKLLIGDPKTITCLQSHSREQAEVWTVKQQLVTVVYRMTGETLQAILVTKLSQCVNPIPPRRRGAPTGTRAKWKLKAEEEERKLDEKRKEFLHKHGMPEERERAEGRFGENYG